MFAVVAAGLIGLLSSCWAPEEFAMARRRFRSEGRARSERSARNFDVGLRATSGYYKHNGRRCFASDDSLEGPAPPRSCLSIFVDRYRHDYNLFRRYCAEGRCTPKQLHTIECLLIEGLSLRELAKLDGVSPQSITARIAGLAGRAPEFCRWWRRLHASRARSWSRRTGRICGTKKGV